MAHVGASGQRGKEAPSSAAARVQEAGDVLVPWGTSRGPEGLLRGAQCRPPSPHLCRLLCEQRPLGGSGQVGGPSFPAAPPAPGWVPAAELLVPEALAPPGSPGSRALRSRAPRVSSETRRPSCRKIRWIHSRLLTRDEVVILSQEEFRDNREKEKTQRGLLGHSESMG